MGPLIWPLALLLLGVLFILLEVFIPSGGVLSFLAGVAVITAIVMAFVTSGMATGTVFLAATTVLVIAVVSTAVRVWPHTPIGRLIMIQPSDRVTGASPEVESLHELVGRQGTAKCEMLPGGVIEIDRRPFDAISEGQPIAQGEVVEVVAVRGGHIVVRSGHGGRPKPNPTPDDILSQPIETVGLEALDDPLA